MIGDISETRGIGRGVGQGCLLSPLLFSLYVEMMMGEAMEELEERAKARGYLLRDVRFADNQYNGDQYTERAAEKNG